MGKPKNYTNALLQCLECKEYTWNWELSHFKKTFKRKLKVSKTISKFCCICDKNTPHKFSGIVETVFKLVG
jgi:hypothetical protein